MCHAGVDGILPHYARQLSDAASSMCACLKILLQLHQPQADLQPPPKRAKHYVNDDIAQEHDPASQQGQLLQRAHQQQQQQQECTLQQLQPSDHMQQQQQEQQQHLQEQVRDQLPVVITSPTQLPSHSQPTFAEGLPHMAQKPANKEAALEGVHEVVLEGTLEAALEGTQEPAQAVGDIWQTLTSVGTASQQELHRLLAQQCREEDVQVAPDFTLADELQLACLGARSDFHAADVSPSGKDAAKSYYSSGMLNAKKDVQHVTFNAASHVCCSIHTAQMRNCLRMPYFYQIVFIRSLYVYI